MDKNAKMSGVAIMIVVLLVGAAGFVGYTQFSQSQSGSEIAQIISETGCELDPTISSIVIDEINPGTTPSGSGMKAVVNGKYRGTILTTTKFAKNDKVEVLLNGTGYISEAVPEISIGCGVNTVTAELLKLDGSPTVKVFNDVGNVVSDNAAPNVTTGNGSTAQGVKTTPFTMAIKLTTPADEAINGMVLVIESENTTQVDDMILSSGSATVEKVSTPEIHSAESSSNVEIIKAWRVTDIADDGAVTTFNLNVQPESSATVNGTSFYVTWYIEDTYVDTDGTLKIGIEDSDGTAKHVSAASSDYDFCVGDGEACL